MPPAVFVRAGGPRARWLHFAAPVNLRPPTHSPPSDALVLFGVTGDLARKMTFPALYAMALKRTLTVPVIGVAAPSWDVSQLRERAVESIKASGALIDKSALRRLLSRFTYVSGDYNDPATFAALKRALGNVRRPAFYLAIPPSLFATVIQGLEAAGLAHGGRVIVEKPFGRDLASARKLNAVARATFPEASIFRIDHYLGKEAIMNILYFRFANSFLEPIWNRNYISSVQILLAEKIGVGGRGGFYESAGCLRDVVENHLFQVVALLAMEPPVYQGYGSVRSEKTKVFQAMRPLRSRDLVRGQYAGYLREPGVARNSDVETFCAARLFIDSWRWEGVPWYLRAGKALRETVAEVVVELKPPPTKLFADSIPRTGPANYLRFRLAPTASVALAARVKRPGKEFVGEQHELYMGEELSGSEAPYERLLTDAMNGDGALFSPEDAVEAAWAVVEPVLKRHSEVIRYRRRSWGPSEADTLLTSGERWRNPTKSGPNT